jgi:hypothetical protein
MFKTKTKNVQNQKCSNLKKIRFENVQIYNCSDFKFAIYSESVPNLLKFKICSKPVQKIVQSKKSVKIRKTKTKNENGKQNRNQKPEN